jgi:hypothetical protein
VRRVDETTFAVGGRIENLVGRPRRGQRSWIGISFLTWTDGTPVRGSVKTSGGRAPARRRSRAGLAADGVTGQRFNASRWDAAVSETAAAANAVEPAGWVTKA